jgi:AcrR family transcriptional regulator
MPSITRKKPRSAGAEAQRLAKRNQILETAAELFARHGYADTDTQLLADTLDIGKGTIYRYFKNKRDLFLSAVDRVMHLLRETIDERVDGIDDPLERIIEAIHTYLKFFADHPEFVELLMQERAQFKDRKKHTYFKHREANVERWRDLYRSLIAAGRVRNMSVEQITNVLSQTLYGTIFVNCFTGQRVPPEQQAREILDVVFHGILTEDEQKKRRPR